MMILRGKVEIVVILLMLHIQLPHTSYYENNQSPEDGNTADSQNDVYQICLGQWALSNIVFLQDTSTKFHEKFKSFL
jgi:hypothetical protein